MYYTLFYKFIRTWSLKFGDILNILEAQITIFQLVLIWNTEA